MYRKIKNTPHVLDKYAEKLIQEGVVTPEEVKVRRTKYAKSEQWAEQNFVTRTVIRYHKNVDVLESEQI